MILVKESFFKLCEEGVGLSTIWREQHFIWPGGRSCSLESVGVSGSEEHGLGRMQDGATCHGENFMLEEIEHKRLEAQKDLAESVVSST